MGVDKTLYGLPTSGNRWRAHVLHTLRKMGFKPTRFYPDVWIRGREGGYGYIGNHTDEVLVVAVDPTSIFLKLKDIYTIKLLGPPVAHIGCYYAPVKKEGVTSWFMGSTIYIA